ncbi:MAG TPA: DUF6249 domain-containing protein [Verrucomicrobiae bacterium]|jgi:hypothetical protein
MKIISTKILAALFLFALAVVPLRAQTNTGIEKDTNHASAMTNAPATGDTAPPVRIDASGIHVGGQSPVDIGTGSFGETVTGIVAIIAGCSIPIAIVAVVGLGFYFRLRRNKMLHETLRAMIDKGVPIPPELLSKSIYSQGRRPRNDRRTGLILIGLGSGLAIFTSHRVGFIILFMGAAFLLVSLLEKKNKNDDQPPQP